MLLLYLVRQQTKSIDYLYEYIHMKKYTFLLPLMVFVLSVRGQSLERSVIASGGAMDKAGNYSLEWTLGEPVSSTSYTDSKIYTQGFNQPYLKVKFKTIVLPSLITYKLTVAPNPVQSVLNVYWWTDQEPAINLRLSDAYGRILTTKSFNVKSGNTQFDMRNMAGGMYFLQVHNSKGILINTYQIVKPN